MKKLKKTDPSKVLLKKWGKILGYHRGMVEILSGDYPVKKSTLLKKIRKAKKIELCSQEKIKELEPYIDEVVRALGHKEALVTDESMVSDFLDIVDKKRWAGQIAKAKKKLGVEVFSDDYIWEVAERLEKRK